jgi:hypothetical protein
MILKVFDGKTFKPKGIVPNLQVNLGGKTLTVNVEVLDSLIDYNLLLG